LSAAAQPPAGSASTNVPPAAGTLAPATRTVPEFTATTVPFCSTTRTRAVVPDTRHSANSVVWLTGRKPGTPSSSRARAGLIGAGSRT
jgi:hypothetical protein